MKKYITMICVVTISIITLLLLPYLLVNFHWFYCLESKSAYTIGGAIGGLTAPIIGIMLAIITYLAFSEQINANKQVTHDMKIGRIEAQFYQMLELHRENVKSFRFIPNKGRENITGRKAFEKIQGTVLKYYNLSNQSNSKEKLKEAYNLMFDGSVKKNALCGCHSVEIAHYIRQLFQTVKFIANNKDLSDEQKHEYLRQLRAQMSTDEQIHLFYNWYSDRGPEWQNDDNNFFTEFRMIHNIFPDRMPEEIKKELLNNSIAKVEHGINSLGYSIYEFQDWADYIKVNKDS